MQARVHAVTAPEGLRSWDQEIVLGGVIVLAVLFDRIKQRGWLRWRRAYKGTSLQ